MWRVTRKGLLAHKLRLAMTALAVVLGVAFVAGSFVLTDTIERSFSGLIEEIAGGVDLVVRPEGAEGDFATGFAGQQPTLPADVVEDVRAVEGVAHADPVVMGQAQVIDDEGEPVGGMGPPTLGYNAPSDPEVGDTDVREGRLPEEAGEVAVDAYTARTQDLAVGETIPITAGGPVEEVELVGIVGFGEADNLLGATVLLFDLDTALERFSSDGEHDEVEVLVADDAEPAAVADRVAAAIGDDVGAEVVTADEIVEESSAAISDTLGVFSTALLVFAGVALFVGVFIIVNTFSITVAQRVREFALLRAVGASRRQVLGSVLTEAALLGVLGGVVGLGLGVLLAAGLRELLASVGMELPAQGLIVLPRTVVVALVVGVVVTVGAAVAPALKTTRIAPVQALQAAAAPPPPRRGWVRPLLGGLVTAGGLALLVVGLFAGAGAVALGAGAAGVFVGVALLSPLLVRPLVAGLGAPVARLLGVRGELARENARRNPRRTATTASALMIGVGLVSFVTVFGASMTASLTAAVEDVYRLDLDVRSTSFQPISGELADELDELDEVALAVEQRMGFFEHDGEERFLAAMDVEEVPEIYAIDVLEGSLADVADGGVALAESVAESDEVALGDDYAVTLPDGEEIALEVAAIYDGSSIDVTHVVDSSTYAEHYPEEQTFAVGLRLADDTSPEEGQAAVDAVLEDYPGVAAMDRAAVSESLTDQVDQLVTLVYGLLGLAVVIAVVGIVNTLALSVFERIREIGLLRAVGMSRRQVRSMVRWESVLISVLGVTLGLGIGVFFGWLLVRALEDDFPLELVIPGGQLLAAVVIAVVAGILAGVLPARRAARVDVLRAVTTE